MKKSPPKNCISLDIDNHLWNHFFTVAPLIVVGTKEGEGYDMAPKHMATPVGPSNFFGFVCTPNHTTYHNVKEHGEFTISFPIPDQIVPTSLSASPRTSDQEKSEAIIRTLPTIPATTIDALFIANSYVYLECRLFKVIDGFDDYSFITGEIKAAFVHSDYLRVSEKDEQHQIREHPLLAYVAYGRFTTISNTYEFPFPKGFMR